MSLEVEVELRVLDNILNMNQSDTIEYPLTLFKTFRRRPLLLTA